MTTGVGSSSSELELELMLFSGKILGFKIDAIGLSISLSEEDDDEDCLLFKTEIGLRIGWTAGASLSELVLLKDAFGKEIGVLREKTGLLFSSSSDDDEDEELLDFSREGAFKSADLTKSGCLMSTGVFCPFFI